MKVSFPFLVSACILAIPAISAGQTINQDQFLNLLIERHPIFDRERLTAQIERDDQAGYLGIGDTHLSYGLNLAHQTPDIAFAGPERMSALGLQGGFQRLNWNTGGTLFANASASGVGLAFPASFPGDFPRFVFQNQVEIGYSLPLKRNRGGFLTRFQYELKNFDIDFSEVQAQENLEEFLADAVSMFLDWVYLEEQRNIIAERLRLSEEELARVQRRREANLVDEVDVIRAEDVVSIWRQNQVLIESQWRAMQAELSVLAQDEGMLNLSPQYDLYDIGELPSLESTLAQLNENVRLLRIIQVRVDQSQFVRRQFEEVMKPDLSLTAYFNTKELSDDVMKSVLMDKPDLTLGLQYSIPIQNRTAKAQIERTNSQITQLEYQAADIRLKLASVLTNLHIQMSELQGILNLNIEQIASAERRTAEELRMYNQGRGNLTFVIQSQDSEQNARLTYAANAATYHKLMIQFLSLLDQVYTQ
jgi:outer membrane protein TolC